MVPTARGNWGREIGTCSHYGEQRELIALGRFQTLGRSHSRGHDSHSVSAASPKPPASITQSPALRPRTRPFAMTAIHRMSEYLLSLGFVSGYLLDGAGSVGICPVTFQNGLHPPACSLRLPVSTESDEKVHAAASPSVAIAQAIRPCNRSVNRPWLEIILTTSGIP